MHFSHIFLGILLILFSGILVSKTEKKKKAHEEIKFHNSIQDWVFTTVY